MNSRYVFMKNWALSGYACSDIDTVNKYLDEIFTKDDDLTIINGISIVCNHDIWKVFDNKENCFIEFNLETKITVKTK